MLARAPAQCFSRKFLCFRFSRSLKAIRRQRVRFGLSFTVVNVIKMIFVFKLRLHEGRRSPAIIWLCLWFSSICFGEISQNFHSFVKIVLLVIYKPKKQGSQKQFSPYFQFCFFSSISNLVLWFFFSTGTRKATNMFNASANLRKFHLQKPVNLIRKIPIFFV